MIPTSFPVNLGNYSQLSPSFLNLMKQFITAPLDSDRRNLFEFAKYWFNLDGTNPKFPPLPVAVSWQLLHATNTQVNSDLSIKIDSLFSVAHLTPHNLVSLYRVLNSYHQLGSTELSKNIIANLDFVQDHIYEKCCSDISYANQMLDAIVQINDDYNLGLLSNLIRKVTSKPSTSTNRECVKRVQPENLTSHHRLQHVLETFESLPIRSDKAYLYRYTNNWFNLNGKTVTNAPTVPVAVVEQIWEAAQTKTLPNGLTKISNGFVIHHLNPLELAWLYRILNSYHTHIIGPLPQSLRANLEMIQNHMCRMHSEIPEQAEETGNALAAFKDPNLDTMIKTLEKTIQARRSMNMQKDKLGKPKFIWYPRQWFSTILADSNGTQLALGAKPLKDFGHEQSLTAHFKAFVSVVQQYELTFSAQKPFNVSVTPSDLQVARVRQFHLNTKDGQPPEIKALKQSVMFIKSNIDQGRPVYVHCGAGCGRSPVVVACFLSQYKRDELNIKSYEDAIDFVIKKRRYVCLKGAQKAQVKNYWDLYVANTSKS